VRVLPDTATSGSYSALTFRVPNESATADTVKISVELPQTQPFLSVRSKPVPGWTSTAVEAELPTPVNNEGTTITRAVRTVTWTAETGAGLSVDEYQEFSLSVGPLPAPGKVLLPATQTYSDGTVVRWDQPVPASGDEPEHPAPVLDVMPAATGADASSAPAGNGEVTAAAAAPDRTARWLGGGGLALGLVAALLAIATRRSAGRVGPRPGASSSTT
jgi:uncharacterized protein YcnI